MEERHDLMGAGKAAHQTAIEGLSALVTKLLERVAALELEREENEERAHAYDTRLAEIQERRERQREAALEGKQRDVENEVYAMERKLADADTRARRGW